MQLALCKLAREPRCVPGQLANTSLSSPVPDPQDLGVSEHWLRLLKGRWRKLNTTNKQRRCLKHTSQRNPSSSKDTRQTTHPEHSRCLLASPAGSGRSGAGGQLPRPRGEWVGSCWAGGRAAAGTCRGNRWVSARPGRAGSRPRRARWHP